MADENYKRLASPCLGSGCVKSSWARGMCKTHYSRWRKHGDCETTKTPLRLPDKCEVDGCERRPHTRQCLYRYGTESPPPDAPPDPMPLCQVHKCRDEVRSRNSPYCEKHYARARRGAEIETDRPVVGRYYLKSGYVKLLLPKHPLADSKGCVYEHRDVAYLKHGGQCPECFWCGRKLAWSVAVIDHFNEQKADNAPDNLLVSCSQCNRARGAMKPFVRSMREDAIPWLQRFIRDERGRGGCRQV
jgi:hypothetical protein